MIVGLRMSERRIARAVAAEREAGLEFVVLGFDELARVQCLQKCQKFRLGESSVRHCQLSKIKCGVLCHRRAMMRGTQSVDN